MCGLMVEDNSERTIRYPCDVKFILRVLHDENLDRAQRRVDMSIVSGMRTKCTFRSTVASVSAPTELRLVAQ